MLTAIIFLIVLTILVFVHELGHFLAAKLFKIRVDEFAIGFPPRIWSFMLKGTRFAVNIVPLGGYVKIHGENGEDESGGVTPDSILAKPRWQQAIVLIAGVFFNIILTWILISLAFMVGTKSSVAGFPPEKISDRSVMVVYVAPNSPANISGLKTGDTILSISDESKSRTVTGKDITVSSVQDFIQNSTTSIALTYTPASNPGDTSADISTTTSVTIVPKEGVVPGKKAIGISMEEVGTVKLGFFSAIGYGLKSTWVMLQNITVGLGQFAKGLIVSDGGAKQALESVAGPVGIANIVGASARDGMASLLFIVAVISANLAVINMVPFPALDGGRLVIVAIEGTIRRRLNKNIVNWANVIGFFLLIGLMLVVTYKDIWNLVK